MTGLQQDLNQRIGRKRFTKYMMAVQRQVGTLYSTTVAFREKKKKRRKLCRPVREHATHVGPARSAGGICIRWRSSVALQGPLVMCG